MEINRLCEVSECPLCGKKDNSPYNFENVKVGHEAVVLGLNQCGKCSMQYISPRLNEEGLKLLYSDYGSATFSGKYHTEEEVSILEYKAFNSYIRDKMPKGGKILDVGCGIGNLMGEFKDASDFKMSGIEFSEVAAQKAIKRGFDVKIGNLQDENYPTGSYDAVTLLYVLEHVSNPRQILSEINRILKDDGLLFMAVPNYRYLRTAFDNPLSRLFLGKKASLHAEEHLQNFTPITIRKMLDLENFEVISEKMATPLNTGSVVVKTFKWTMYVVLKLLFVLGYNAGGIHIIAKKRNV